MSRARISAAMLLILPLALLPAACGDRGQSRDALRNDEQGRDLDLALRGDTASATFKDTALVRPPVAEKAPEPEPEPAPAPQPRREYNRPRQYVPPPRPRPAPTYQAPDYSAPAPEPGPARERSGGMATLPSGSTFAVSLNQTLSTQTNQAGDDFTATVTQAVVGQNGAVVIPAGATVHGRVTSVAKSDHVGEAAVMNLAFESVSFGGRSYPLDATVQEAHPQRVTTNTVGRTAGRAAAGAAAGAVLSKILGGGSVKGAIIGAAAGTAIAMGTADVNAVLPQGSTVVIRTDAPVSVAQR